MPHNRGHIFVSYSHNDDEQVAPVCKALEARSYSLWLDHAQLRPGDNLTEEIDRALQDSVAFIAFVGQHYFRDGKYTRLEYYGASALARSSPSWRMIMVRLDKNAEIPPMSLDRLRIEYTNPEYVADAIAAALDRFGAVDGVAYSDRVAEPESKWRPLEIETLSDLDLRLVVRGFMEQRIDKLRRPDELLKFEIELSHKRTVRFSLLRAIVEDDVARFKLETQLHQIEISQRYVKEVKETLINGLLGRFEIPYKLLLEEHQQKSDQAHQILRRCLKDLAENIQMRTALGDL